MPKRNTTRKKIFKKKNSKLIVVAIILLVSSLLVIFKFLKHSPKTIPSLTAKPQPTVPSPTPIKPLVDPRIFHEKEKLLFRDSTNGYMLDLTSLPESKLTDADTHVLYQIDMYRRQGEQKRSTARFGISKPHDPQGLTLQEFAAKEFTYREGNNESGWGGLTTSPIEQVVIGKKYRGIHWTETSNSDEGYFFDKYLFEGRGVYIYIYMIAWEKPVFDKNKAIFKKILDTFTFTQFYSSRPTFLESTSWKTYTNVRFGYQLEYPATESYEEYIDQPYGYTDVARGCFAMYAVPQNVSIPSELRLSRAQLTELESLEVGNTKTYTDSSFEGEDGFALKLFYKKLPEKQISGVSWSSFDITNNWENHGSHYIYFVNKNNNTYLLNFYAGVCPDEMVQKMLSTVKLN